MILNIVSSTIRTLKATKEVTRDEVSFLRYTVITSDNHQVLCLGSFASGIAVFTENVPHQKRVKNAIAPKIKGIEDHLFPCGPILCIYVCDLCHHI